jgi:dephospho-CoA kinase
MKEFLSHLAEGVYDKGIFKAFFLAGGPGSGKTFVTQNVFSGSGLKLVNSDAQFERKLIAADYSLSMPPEQIKGREVIRTAAKRLTADLMTNYLMGRLGVIVDGTARDYQLIERQVQLLRTTLGYDCYMIFVNTSLDVALERNAGRIRRVPVDVTKQSWKIVQSNMGKFQYLFGRKNFIIVDNNNANEDILKKVAKKIRIMMSNPIQSFTAKRWIVNQLKAKKRV